MPILRSRHKTCGIVLSERIESEDQCAFMIKPKALEFASGGETRWFVSLAIGFKVVLLLVFLAFGVANQAGAILVNISFNDGHGDVGSGVMNITGANNTFQAVGGYLDVTSGGAV